MNRQKILLVLLFSILFDLSSCGTVTIDFPESDRRTQYSPVSESESDPYDGVTDKNPNEKSDEEIITYYVSLYSAENVYRDMFAPQNLLLIGDDFVVGLFVMNPFSQTVEIRKNNVERIGNTSFGTFSTIEVFDKSGQCVSVTVSPALAAEIVTILNESTEDVEAPTTCGSKKSAIGF